MLGHHSADSPPDTLLSTNGTSPAETMIMTGGGTNLRFDDLDLCVSGNGNSRHSRNLPAGMTIQCYPHLNHARKCTFDDGLDELEKPVESRLKITGQAVTFSGCRECCYGYPFYDMEIDIPKNLAMDV